MPDDSDLISLDDVNYIILKKGVVHDIPDRESYYEFSTSLPVFHSHSVDKDIIDLVDFLISIDNITLVDRFRLSILKSLLLNTRHIGGEVWECGVYRGGTARYFSQLLSKYFSDKNIPLRLFDTFAGMPITDSLRDIHSAGDFADTSLEIVKQTIGDKSFVEYYPGFLPDTFVGLEHSVIRFIHIDLDIYDAIKSAVSFAYPRIPRGGMIVFDDYGFASCPGARMAVEEFFSDKPEVPVVLPTGQAFVIRQG